MAVLLDTNVLVRMTDTLDPHHADAMQAVAKLHRLGEWLQIATQNLVEFRNVCTRPRRLNGLAMTTHETEQQADRFEQTLALLPDTPQIHPQWKSIVSALGIIGKQVHDARLVAVCHAHGVAQILTFNEAHFVRFTSFGPGLVVLHPSRV